MGERAELEDRTIVVNTRETTMPEVAWEERELNALAIEILREQVNAQVWRDREEAARAARARAAAEEGNGRRIRRNLFEEGAFEVDAFVEEKPAACRKLSF